MMKINMFKSRKQKRDDEKKKREEAISKELGMIIERLQKNEITGQQLNQEIERLLYEVRMGKK